jgi:multidrug efflux pump subunit AcrA (membrane-fusion protein)
MTGVPAAALRFKPSGEGGASGGAPGGASVYVLVNGRLARRAVTTGISDGKYVQIVKGDLKAGEPVVVGETLSGDSTTSPRGFHMRVF